RRHTSCYRDWSSDVCSSDLFDFTYDKRLYDRLRAGQARPVREHFWAGLDYQNKMARFLENHDEPRAATAFAPPLHEAAAVITFLDRKSVVEGSGGDLWGGRM